MSRLRWPAKSHRDELVSERYLVLKPEAKRSAESVAEGDADYGELRRLCAALMEFADPTFEWSGIAVTMNFEGRRVQRNARCRVVGT